VQNTRFDVKFQITAHCSIQNKKNIIHTVLEKGKANMF